MKVTAHPRFQELLSVIEQTPRLARRWRGIVFRSVTLDAADHVKILSGQGSFRNGGRWNAIGSVRAAYASTKPEVALAEALSHYRYYGLQDEDAMPRVTVALQFKLRKVLNLTNLNLRRKVNLNLPEIMAEDWRKFQDTKKESQSQSLGRAVAAAGFEGMLVPSAVVPNSINLVYFPDNAVRGSVAHLYEK
jgi:RES domain-containing protein